MEIEIFNFVLHAKQNIFEILELLWLVKKLVPNKKEIIKQVGNAKIATNNCMILSYNLDKNYQEINL